MSHHKKIIIDGIEYGYLRITNEGQVLSIWINQPWGTGDLFIPEEGYREDLFTDEKNQIVIDTDDDKYPVGHPMFGE